MVQPQPGLVVLDKPAGWTSHDAVARVRRVVRTRRVGHAGTLDPMATGVLVLGVGRATKLLGQLSLATKEYVATVRLGVSTVTDDAEGEVVERCSTRAVSWNQVTSAVSQFVGEIEQVPAAVSAVKVGGVRAYARVRAGESVQLAARRVTVFRFEVIGGGNVGDYCDVQVRVECSSGTYVRALARDLGAVLGVGGHVTMLRRTRVGPFTLAEARTFEQLETADDPVVLSLSAATALAFPRRDVTAHEARMLAHGGFLAPVGRSEMYAAFAPGGHVVALVRERQHREKGLVAAPTVVFADR